MEQFYLEVRRTYKRYDGGAIVIVETWQCFINSPIIAELLGLVSDKPLLSRSNYRITNNKQQLIVTF